MPQLGLHIQVLIQITLVMTLLQLVPGISLELLWKVLLEMIR